MPAKSKAQYRAMQAAAHGKSTLGIPKKVGAEYVAATASPKSLPKRKGDPPVAKHFIQKAIKHPGALHRELGVPEGEKIPASKIAAAAKKGGKLGQRARFAQTLAHLHSPDRYDDESTNDIPARREYHSAQEQASGSLPSAKGFPDIQTNDPAGSPRVSVKTMQAGTQSTPGSQKNSWPSKAQSYSDDEV